MSYRDEIDYLRDNFEPGSCIPDEEQMVSDAMTSAWPATAMMQLFYDEKIGWSKLVKHYKHWRGQSANLQDAAEREQIERRAA